MTAQEKLNAMVMAMIGDDEWVALVEDSIAAEDAIEQLFGTVEADESQLTFILFDEDVDDRYFGSIEDDHEWIARGGSGGFI